MGTPSECPGLILGTAWASAAYSKMEGGPEWILGGAVKYHWVIDAAKGAPVEWGLWVASHHWASVLMSFSAVFFEAVFVLSVFARPGRWRNVLALTGLLLLIGFHLFHNVLWWSWWLVYLSFAIPWTGLYDLAAARVGGWPPVAGTSATPSSPGSRRDLRPVHMVLIALVCVHGTLELPEGFGRFGSYSNTYASTAAFDTANVIEPVDRLWIGYGTAQPTEVANAERAGERDSRIGQRRASAVRPRRLDSHARGHPATHQPSASPGRVARAPHAHTAAASL